MPVGISSSKPHCRYNKTKSRISYPHVGFGEQLLKVRRAAELTQAQVAAMIGVCFATYSKWETGKSLPSDAHVRKFIDAMKDRDPSLQMDALQESLEHMPAARPTPSGEDAAEQDPNPDEADQPPHAKFGERLAEARLAARLSQHELGALAGTSQMNISRAEMGRSMPRLTTLGRLVEVLQERVPTLSLESLLEGTGVVAPGVARTLNAVLTRDELSLLELAREVGLPVARRRILGLELQPQP